MNAVLVFVVAASIVGVLAANDEAHAEYMKKIKEFMPDCEKENDVDLKTLLAGLDKDARMKMFEESKKLRCFSKCMSLKFGFINAAGEPQLDKIKDTFRPADNTIIDDIKKCTAEITDTDLCDKAYKTKKCVMDKTMKKP